MLDPGYRSGPLTSPWSVEDSIARVRRICDRIGVEVQVPEKAVSPFATSAVDLGDCGILITGGDPGVRECCAAFAGSDTVIATRVSLEAYAVFAAAGVHCLVTEMPEPLVRPAG
jgi:hypothetical protein